MTYFNFTTEKTNAQLPVNPPTIMDICCYAYWDYDQKLYISVLCCLYNNQYLK